ANTQSVDSVLPITLSLRDIEKFHIERVLKSKNWNQSATAQLLGIDRKTLRNKIREFKLEKEIKESN
ncbi:MAG: helix-turn-helix domain-containing protein, partial [Armatimonadota bacterium]